MESESDPLRVKIRSHFIALQENKKESESDHACMQTRKMTSKLPAQGASQKKNTGFFGSFSQMSDPPPLFGRPPSKKKFEGLFCILGPKEHFWFLQVFTFCQYSDIYIWE